MAARSERPRSSRRAGLLLAGVGVAAAAALGLLWPRTGPPPLPGELADRVRRAHAAEARRGAELLQGEGVAPQLADAMESLHRAESGRPDPAAAPRAQAAARDAARLLGPGPFRALAVHLAVRAVAALEQAADAGRLGLRTPEEAVPVAGAFYEQVLRPTGLLGPDGSGPAGWQATAETLFLVRLSRLARDATERPKEDGLSREELLLYLRWKVERAEGSTTERRLKALERLRELDPTYPAEEARARLQTDAGG